MKYWTISYTVIRNLIKDRHETAAYNLFVKYVLIKRHDMVPLALLTNMYNSLL